MFKYFRYIYLDICFSTVHGHVICDSVFRRCWLRGGGGGETTEELQGCSTLEVIFHVSQSRSSVLRSYHEFAKLKHCRRHLLRFETRRAQDLQLHISMFVHFHDLSHELEYLRYTLLVPYPSSPRIPSGTNGSSFCVDSAREDNSLVTLVRIRSVVDRPSKKVWVREISDFAAFKSGLDVRKGQGAPVGHVLPIGKPVLDDPICGNAVYW